MSSALTLVVITVIFVFHRLLMLFMIKLYLRIFFLLSEKTFIFIFLQNERKFGSKFAIILVIPRDNVFLPVKIVRATGRRKACYFHANYNAKLLDISCQTT